jgi:hypothetical protein
MIKKILIYSFIFSLSFNLLALRPGENALELKNVKWLSGIPVMMGFPPKVENFENLELKILVFMLTKVPGSTQTVQMLDSIKKQYGRKIQLAIVTTDPESDAKDLIKNFRYLSLSFAIDYSRNYTNKYMAGSLHFPMAFVIDRSGKIIWNGESNDLSEMLENYFNNKFNKKIQPQLSKLTDELHQLIRGNSEQKMRRTVEKIFDLDPENASALRIRLFVLENSNRVFEAWNLLLSRIKATPHLTRLYFTAADLISRYNFLEPNLTNVIEQFTLNTQKLAPLNMMVWTLLTYYPNNHKALTLSSNIIIKADTLINKETSYNDLAQNATVKAMLASKLGYSELALKQQKIAAQMYIRANNMQAASATQVAEKYYQTQNSLRKNKNLLKVLVK